MSLRPQITQGAAALGEGGCALRLGDVSPAAGDRRTAGEIVLEALARPVRGNDGSIHRAWRRGCVWPVPPQRPWLAAGWGEAAAGPGVWGPV